MRYTTSAAEVKCENKTDAVGSISSSRLPLESDEPVFWPCLVVPILRHGRQFHATIGADSLPQYFAPSFPLRQFGFLDALRCPRARAGRLLADHGVGIVDAATHQVSPKREF